MMRTLGFSAMVVCVRVKCRVKGVCSIARRTGLGVVESAIDPAQCGDRESENATMWALQRRRLR